MAWMYKVKVGKGMLEISENDFKSLWQKASLIGDFPDKCGKCNSEEIAPMHKSPKGNDYWGLKCRSCGSEFTLHQKKEGGFYVRYDDEWTKYGEDAPQKSQEETVREVFEDDVPF